MPPSNFHLGRTLKSYYRTRVLHPSTPRCFKIFLKDTLGNYVSLFHDVKLVHHRSNEVFNMVVEMPMYAIYKTQISLTETLNPIVAQFNSSGKVIEMSVEFPETHAMPWNQGKLPRTFQYYREPGSWSYKEATVNGSQVYVIDVSGVRKGYGEVVAIKVLEAYKTENANRWSECIVVGNAVKYNNYAIVEDNIDDVQRRYANVKEKIMDWLKQTGRRITRVMNMQEAVEMIEEKVKNWENLMKSTDRKLKTLNGLKLENTTLNNKWKILQNTAHVHVMKASTCT